jgi:MFS family permease
VLAKSVFDAGDAGFGFMLAAMGSGLVLGSLLGGGWLARHGAGATYATSIALLALGTGGVAVSPSVWPALPMLVIAGVGNGAALVCNSVLIQRDVPDQLRGRAFTLAMSLTSAAFGIGMIVAGPLTEALGAREVWAISAGLLAVAAVAAGVLTRGIEATSEPRRDTRVRTQHGA